MGSAEVDRPRRRCWLQFSLRGLFALMLLVALGLGWIASERQKVSMEARATRAIHSANGLVLTDVDGAYRNCRWPWDWAAWKEKLFGANVGSPVSRIRLHPDTNLDLLGELRHMRALTNLYLDGTRVGDGDVERMLELQSLVSLSLSATDITDVGAMRLASLPNLKKLDLDHTVVTDRALEVLSGLNLESLSICDTDISIEAAERYLSSHVEWQLGEQYAPCPSPKHREAAVRLIRQGASVSTNLPVSFWDPVLNPHEDTESYLPFTVVSFMNGRLGTGFPDELMHPWKGALDDQEALADLVRLRSINVNCLIPDALLQQLSQTRLANDFCLEQWPGNFVSPKFLKPLAEASFERLTMDLLAGQSLDFLPEMQNLRELRLRGYGLFKLTRSLLAALKDCDTLESLILDRVEISPDIFAVLAACPRLGTLTLYGVEVPNESPRGLGGLANLRCLRLGYGDIDLARIGELPALEELVWDPVYTMTDEELEALCRLSRLRRLSLREVDLSDEILARIASLHNLEALEVIECGPEYEMMWDGLEEPWAESNHVSEVGLRHLRQLPRLREVRLQLVEDGFAAEVVEAFEKEIGQRAVEGKRE